VEYAHKFAQHMTRGTSVVFVGKPGTGKTHLSVGIGLAIMREGRTVRYVTVQRAVRRVKDTWHKESKERESDALRWMTEVDLLILDEVGVQFGSDFEKNLLFEVLNSRYESRRPSVILSNLSQPEVQNYLGERVVDRIREDGGRVMTFDWASHRRTAVS
jgi:DNA replication protein DnaC